MTNVSNLALAYRDRIATQLVLIRRAFLDSEGNQRELHGTGVIIGHGKGANQFIKIATAGHVLSDAGPLPSIWELTRVDGDANGRRKDLRQTFTEKSSSSQVPHVLCCEYLQKCDIGMIVIENSADSSGELFIDTAMHKPLVLSPRTGYPQVGTRVAWAGYPGFAKGVHGSFVPCYFEGVVSATPSDQSLYLVDGHTAPGVSGGPLWIDRNGEPIVIGVCIDYRFPDGNPPLPGLVGFCPLSVLLNHIDQMTAG